MAKIKNGLGPDHITSDELPDMTHVVYDNTTTYTLGGIKHFVGDGRPDTAPPAGATIGSTYLCTEPTGYVGGVYNNGAKQWVYAPPQRLYSSDSPDPVWQVTDGECVLVASQKNGLLTGQVPRGFIQFVRNAETVQVTFDCDVLGQNANATSAEFRTAKFDGIKPAQAVIAYLRSKIAATVSGYAFNSHLGHVIVGRSDLRLFDKTGAPLGWQSPIGSSDFAMGGLGIGAAFRDAWPTANLLAYNDQKWNATPRRTLEELRELIETETDPEKLQELKDELEALERSDG